MATDNRTEERKAYDKIKDEKGASPDVIEHHRRMAIQSEAPKATDGKQSEG